jgi:hypothetical protein
VRFPQTSSWSTQLFRQSVPQGAYGLSYESVALFYCFNGESKQAPDEGRLEPLAIEQLRGTPAADVSKHGDSSESPTPARLTVEFECVRRFTVLEYDLSLGKSSIAAEVQSGRGLGG